MHVKVKNLNKVYTVGNKEFYALKNINFSITKGEICVILGPSGSGKSTLLNIIGGLDSINSGEVEVDGINISNLSDKQLCRYRRDNLGFVFQFYNLIPNLTVKENIEVCSNISKNPLDIDFIIESIGLKDEKNKFPKELSGGQQQRVAIGRALVKNPKLLLCDEPTGALDFKSSIEILDLMKRINKDFDTSIIMITHNESIKDISHRVLRLRSGELVLNEVNKIIKEAQNIQW
ncbi:ABC-type antimicrobial peptide transport system, ATPase component [Gottschalkia purinilytica]|uniref:ABC-type antimicrobial peptide transport system, ATPase component n=1 Tax=Gottschalkia purinilytica TaxID=1503 RepID=A0A0L0WBW8_GOTPU|nr:ABC transporter ATP-binding protein [Gottschalkia purinilytica]KNF08963.1 ABC-type antimicrobial peptide transport system, ATPase component [Gottschalkia purinilytica]